MSSQPKTAPFFVFLAEDNRADVSLVNEALKFHGIAYELYVASDCEQATGYLQRVGKSDDARLPSVALLDLNLPKGSGHEILGALRTHPTCANVPVVIVTSSDAPADRTRARQLGATCYFRKPSELDAFMELGAIVKELLQKSEHSSSGGKTI
jgi:CheY-like chemotaxis protein